ncbi:alpha/beta fold hydrolase [Thermosynechococcaceae cyanobacterium BACA0444]|uniref:Alpha/beta fold hydrolase n=1 Tax=Pseudocalidococcus azoricus BACA0444 TaxID=2918990 RepID=A0AAE4FW78_9CYAN|nr:alpha/beta fold hydrolase [Pseudocalidococcus azoricus]MDS3862449.1 alpha/beta fold hydrolase [Pseudocalidococcus azoricus BACA0444]
MSPDSRRSVGSFICLIALPFWLLFLGHMTQSSKSVEVQITTSTGTLYGTQIIPASNVPEPGVLIIAGSGPTDRNGNNPLAGQNNSLKLLAEGLAGHGIAAIRYDKRGIGESSVAGTKEVDLRFDTYVEDAALWIQQLQADSRFSSVTVIGHSEGSLIGMLATQKTGADAFISIAGSAQTASQVLRDQLRPRLPEALWQQSEQILAALEQGNTVTSVPPELNTLYRSSVQPYLISWFRYTPAQEIRRLTVPVLIVQGTTDIQVSVREAQALKMAKPDAELRIIEGMNHVLKAVPLDPEQQNASYSEPTLPVVPELVDGISQFIHSNRMRRESNQLLHRNVPR